MLTMRLLPKSGMAKVTLLDNLLVHEHLEELNDTLVGKLTDVLSAAQKFALLTRFHDELYHGVLEGTIRRINAPHAITYMLHFIVRELGQYIAHLVNIPFKHGARLGHVDVQLLPHQFVELNLSLALELLDTGREQHFQLIFGVLILTFFHLCHVIQEEVVRVTS